MIIFHQDRWFVVAVGCFVMLFWLCLQVPGGIAESVEGEAVTFAYGWWTTFYFLGPALVFFGMGWMLRRRRVADANTTWGQVCLIVGVVCLLLGPLMLSLSWGDRVHIDHDRIRITTGVYRPETREVRFKDCTRLELGSIVGRDSKGNETVSWFLLCHHPQGEPTKLWLGDLEKRAFARIVEKAQDRGISFQLTGERPAWLDETVVPTE